jgi:hypothetical protein
MAPVVVAAVEEMPDGAVESDGDDNLDKDDPHRLLNVDLTAPVDESEMVLPVAQHRVAK